MIVIDTNVLSEVTKPAAHVAPSVKRWFVRQPGPSLYLTAVTVAEVLVGLVSLPAGRRRQDLTTEMTRAMALFTGRTLSFDIAAATAFAEIAVARRRAGFTSATTDLQIAAIARANGMTIATRNIRDFADCGVEIIDPWTAP